MGLLVGFGGNLTWAGDGSWVSKSSETKPRELRIYQNNFQTDEVGPEWSSRSPAPWGVRHAPVPSGFHRKFLGFFGGNEELTLRLRGLPSGTFALVLEFDVYLIGSWDGDDPSQVDSVVLGGPDVFGFRFSDGSQPAWVRQWFFSHSEKGRQNYCGFRWSFAGFIPETSPCAYGQGAFADPLRIGSLGFKVDPRILSHQPALDSVYRFRKNLFLEPDNSFKVLHRGPEASFTFFSRGLQVRSGPEPYYLDESWGVDNVIVTALISD